MPTLSSQERNGSSLPAIKKYIGANYKLPAGTIGLRNDFWARRGRAV